MLDFRSPFSPELGTASEVGTPDQAIKISLTTCPI